MDELQEGHQWSSLPAPLFPTLASVPIQVGTLISYGEDGIPDSIRRMASGSAFVVEVNSGLKFLVTARHCITGRDNDTGNFMSPKHLFGPDHIAIKAPRADMTSEQFSVGAAEESYTTLVMPLYDEAGVPLWYEHEDPAVDIVAIALPEPRVDAETPWFFHAYPKYSWGDQNMMDPARPVVQAGDAVSVVGYPLGLTAHVALPIWTHATIASDMAIGMGASKTFMIDASTTTGNSGSAVVYYRQSGTAWMRQAFRRPYQQIIDTPVMLLLGIYSARLRSTYSEKETTIGRVWSQEILEEIIPMPYGRGSSRRPKPLTSVTGAQSEPPGDEMEATALHNAVSISPEAISLPDSTPLGMGPKGGFKKL